MIPHRFCAQAAASLAAGALSAAFVLASGCSDDSQQTGGGGAGAASGGSSQGGNPQGGHHQGGNGGVGAVGGAAGGGAWTCAPLDCGESTGQTVAVGAADDLQAAIDAAAPGDTLVLPAGAVFSGHFVLRAKSGESCITIRTSTTDADLSPTTRVGPADAGKLAQIVTPGAGLPAVRTEPGAHNYQLIGLELRPESASSEVYEVVALGTSGADQPTLAEVPHHIVIDRSWIHGWPDANFKRGIALNSASTCVIRSTINDFHSDVQDSQALGGHNGPGPFKILDNRLEGGAENIMFGGAVPSIDGLVPSDIEIRGNSFYKPLAWRAGDPANTGYTPWVKNLFELKNARNVLLDGNVLDNNWVGADQHGIAVVLTPRSENGAVPWATVENVRISNNVFRHVGGGAGLLGYDAGNSSQQANHVTFANNLFEDIRQDYALDIVRVMQFTEIATLVVDHNTFVYAPGSWPIFRTYGQPTTDFAYRNNVVEYREGLWADCGTDAQALACLLPGAQFAGNVIVGGGSATLPAGNFYPGTLEEAGFVDYAGGAADFHGYALAPASPYAGQGTDGKTPGFDPAELDLARGSSGPLP